MNKPSISRHLVLAIILYLCSTFATADFVIIVNLENPVTSLTTREVKKLFLGKLRLFPKTSLPVQLVDQGEGEEMREIFYSKFIRMSGARLFRYRASYLFSGLGAAPLVVDGNKSVKQIVSENSSAIGYIHKNSLDDTVKEVYRLQ